MIQTWIRLALLASIVYWAPKQFYDWSDEDPIIDGAPVSSTPLESGWAERYK